MKEFIKAFSIQNALKAQKQVNNFKTKIIL